MNSPRIGIELFNLSHERRIFARGRFTTSYGRVAEHTYRALLFGAPEAWQYELLIAGSWRPRPDEAGAFQSHGTRVHPFFVPPSVPLVNARVRSAWHRYGKPAFYFPYVEKQRYSLLQYTSELPWADRPLAPVECCAAYDYYEAYVDPASWESTRKRLEAHRESLWLSAISEFTRQDAIRLLGLAPERVRTIHIAVDHGIYRPDAQGDDEAHAAKWQLPERYVFYAGSIAARKNVLTLVRALERHNERASEPLPLIIAGNVAGANYLLRRRIWKQIAEIARKTPVRQIGYPTDPEMAFFFRRALMVVHPAVFEGFGLTVLEGMACGAPMICGRHSSLIEVGGDAARFVQDSKDAEELAEAIGEVAGDAARRAELRRLGIIQAARFRWENFARQTVEFYRDMLAA